MINCIFENGNKASLRHVAVDILIINNNKILLVKRALRLIEGGKYGLIGGYLDRDETIIEGAIREVKEETGYNINIIGLLRIKNKPDRDGEDRQIISFVFVAEALDKVGEADDESTEVTWFDLNNLPAKENFAFDHYDDIALYLKNKNNFYPLSILEN
jgi:8-oxo-dGTP diphosphatase